LAGERQSGIWRRERTTTTTATIIKKDAIIYSVSFGSVSAVVSEF